jgi:hypothetical protein
METRLLRADKESLHQQGRLCVHVLDESTSEVKREISVGKSTRKYLDPPRFSSRHPSTNTESEQGVFAEEV